MINKTAEKIIEVQKKDEPSEIIENEDWTKMLEKEDDKVPAKIEEKEDKQQIAPENKEEEEKLPQIDSKPQKREDFGYNTPKEHCLCLTGVERFQIERDIFKFLRKNIGADQKEKSMPLHSIFKKRGNAFAFLNFNSADQKKEFETLFSEIVGVKSKIQMREVNDMKKVEGKPFKNISKFYDRNLK